MHHRRYILDHFNVPHSLFTKRMSQSRGSVKETNYYNLRGGPLMWTALNGNLLMRN